MKRTLLFVVVLLFCQAVVGQPLYVKDDIRTEWLIFDDGQYVPYRDDVRVNAVYLRLDARQYSGDFLQITSTSDVDLFINGMVKGTSRRYLLPLDSLSRAYGSSLLFALHQNGITPNTVRTTLMTVQAPSLMDSMVERESHAFRDFATLAAFFLLAMLIMVGRLNPKLAADYLSITRIFSLREGDDSQLYSRIGNSTNILFYVFCSLLIGYYLLVIFHFVTGIYPIASEFQADTFGGTVGQWFRLSGIVLMIFFAKIILVFGLSSLFGIREVQGIHFFNWVRMLVVFFGVLSVALFIYFLWHGHAVETHMFFLKLLGWISAAWMILIFFKLGGRANASLFHLFSYICATELIPFLLIIKVLYN